jgi:ABC-type antimicrobial peptide transport system permease subunit
MLINVSLAQFGFVLSLIVHVSAAGVLQGVFSDQLNCGEKLMPLPFVTLIWIFFVIAVLAVMASFLASRRILKPDFSEALREGAG